MPYDDSKSGNYYEVLSSFNLGSDATALIGLIASKVDERLKSFTSFG